jgi:hypothetical protein
LRALFNNSEQRNICHRSLLKIPFKSCFYLLIKGKVRYLYVRIVPDILLVIKMESVVKSPEIDCNGKHHWQTTSNDRNLLG